MLMISLHSMAFAQSVAINTDGSLPQTSSILEIKSNTKGILIPGTSTTSQQALLNPAKGLMVYDTTTSSSWIFDGASWFETSHNGNTWSTKGNAGTDTADEGN